MSFFEKILKKYKMKKLAFLFLIVFFFSCEENMPVVPEPPVIDSARKVLVEEFTGVGCVQCPQGSIELENLLGIYGENLVVVSIHAGDFVNPLPESNVNFKTDEGEALIGYLGSPAFYPSAVIDRKDFDGGNYRLQTGRNNWVSFIDQELEEDPRILVNISKNYDESTRELEVEVFGVALEDITGELRITIMIIESNIVDAQLDEQAPSGIVLDYVHKHAFRTTMTNFNGEKFTDQLNEGENYNMKKTMTLPEEWVASECEIIAFVNLIDGQNKEVLQVESTHVND